MKYVRYDDCGRAEYKYEYEVGKCGYAPYEFEFHDGRTSKSRSVTGESQNIKEVIISTKSNSYIGFSVKSKPSWCSVDYRDQTSESMKAVVTLSANTTSSSRSGDIVFVQKESGKTVTLTVTQEGSPETINVNFGPAFNKPCCGTEYDNWTVVISNSSNSYTWDKNTGSQPVVLGTYNVDISYTCTMGSSNTRKAHIYTGSGYTDTITVDKSLGGNRRWDFGCQ